MAIKSLLDNEGSKERWQLIRNIDENKKWLYWRLWENDPELKLWINEGFDRDWWVKQWGEGVGDEIW